MGSTGRVVLQTSVETSPGRYLGIWVSLESPNALQGRQGSRRRTVSQAFGDDELRIDSEANIKGVLTALKSWDKRRSAKLSRLSPLL